MKNKLSNQNGTIRKCEFSETQFSFCFTFEILKTYPNLQMPNFPNTVQEGRAGGGYDVEINGSLFFQFKIPEYLQQDEKYRIKIITKDNQFKLLKKLKRPANIVCYCAPKFYTCNEMENFYCTKQIESNSALFSIEHFPTEGNYHKLLYEYKKDSLKSCGILSSDPKEIKISPGVFSNSYIESPMTLSEKANILWSIIKEINPELGKKESESNKTDRVFSVLLMHYNILWIPIKI